MKKTITYLTFTLLIASFASSSGISRTQASTSCYTFTKNFGLNAVLTSAEAAALKADLVSEGLWSSGVNITSYTTVVSDAVKAFQEKYSSTILVPNGMTSGNGYFGDYTRNKMNNLYGCATTASNVRSGPVPRASTGVVQCPAGFTCTPIAQTTAPVCPAGYTCTLTSSATGAANTQNGSALLGQLIGQLNAGGSSAYLDPAVYNGNANTASDPSQQAATIPPVTSSETVSVAPASADLNTVAAPTVPAAVAAPGTYPLTVNYGQTLDSVVAALAPTSVSDYVSLGMFSNTGSGQKNIVARVLTLAELFPNVTSTIDSGAISKCGCKQNILTNVTYDQFAAAIKAKGYRPITLQELVVLVTRYPQIYGSAFGSTIKVNSVTTFSNTADGPYSGNKTGFSVPFVSERTTTANGKSIRTIGNTDISTNFIFATSKLGNIYANAPVIVVEDSIWVPISRDSLPATNAPALTYGALSAVPSLKYTVQVDYSTYTDGYTNTYQGAGTQQQVMKLLRIVQTGVRSAGMSGRTSQTEVAGLIPAGYRAATAAEMVALAEQYPAASGGLGLMAFGSFYEKCKAYPFIHPDGWGYANGAEVLDNGLVFDNRKYYHSNASETTGFFPRINEILFPIVQM